MKLQFFFPGLLFFIFVLFACSEKKAEVPYISEQEEEPKENNRTDFEKQVDESLEKDNQPF